MFDPHIRPAEFRCCGLCKGDRVYNGTDYDNNCTCIRDCKVSKLPTNPNLDKSSLDIDDWFRGNGNW